jgi:hypothetical protein
VVPALFETAGTTSTWTSPPILASSSKLPIDHNGALSDSIVTPIPRFTHAVFVNWPGFLAMKHNGIRRLIGPPILRMPVANP